MARIYACSSSYIYIVAFGLVGIARIGRDSPCSRTSFGLVEMVIRRQRYIVTLRHSLYNIVLGSMGRILVQVKIYRRIRIGQDGHPKATIYRNVDENNGTQTGPTCALVPKT